MYTASHRNGSSRSWWATVLAAGLVTGGLIGCGDGDARSSGTTASADPSTSAAVANEVEQILVLHDFAGGLRLIAPSTGESEPLDLRLEVGSIAAAPDGSMLVLVEEGTATVHVLDDLGDASSLRRVGDEHPGMAAAPVVSPDGAQVALVVGDRSDEQIVVVDLSSGDRRVVADLSDMAPEPTFACEPIGSVGGGPTAWPDLLVVDTWAQCEEATFEATYLVDVDAADSTVEVQPGVLALSPRGDRYIGAVDHSARVQWAGGGSLALGGGLVPRWSSTGRLAFLQTRAAPGASVFALMILEPEQIEAVEVTRGHVTPIGWSHDGTSLAFWSADTGSLWRWDAVEGADDLAIDQGRVVWATMAPRR